MKQDTSSLGMIDKINSILKGLTFGLYDPKGGEKEIIDAGELKYFKTMLNRGESLLHIATVFQISYSDAFVIKMKIQRGLL